MPAPIVVAKAVIFGIKNWKPIIVAVLAIVMLFVMLPIIAITAFLPSADDVMKSQYEAVAKPAGLDWIELLVYDTVRNQNDFSNVDINKSSFNFIKVTYTISEQKEVETEVDNPDAGKTTYDITYRGGATSTVTEDELDKLPPGSYTLDGSTTAPATITSKTKVWEVVDSGTASSYSEIVSAIKKLGYGGGDPVSLSEMLNFAKGLSGEQYKATVEKLTLLDLVNGLDESQKEWAFDLYTTLIDDNDAFGTGNVREFYNTDPSYMASIVLDDSKYKLGDSKKVTGDKDVNSIFLGRIAALAEGCNKSANITSGYRSVAEQQKIWDKTPVERRGKYVAAPGHSRHQYGLAADVSGWMLYISNTELAKYGLWKPMSYENWHVEPIETKPGANELNTAA